ncbi:heparan sulfate glucosamine 3-O-sulfotransferase 5-like [Strongylocentrotus purpuratus]|uniref:Sulfotransferase domain-containing protein n=1 Tax=Strongylocentrotus purpuratus TaxID=7668 RepID=A0A7M7N634_STRPU|nr:heparan sulfate glucosamine 3-O-sulfotransferase 5-like [Strongylocentrotus purpuratus]XP_030831807.1 heparan sulfate glucosamine 3-O-sulfotransferase 5-like [Strongylocentrotus purpuratus]
MKWKCLSPRSSVAAIFICFIPILIFIFDLSGNSRQGEQSLGNPAHRVSGSRHVSQLTLNSSQPPFTLFQSRWSCKSERAIKTRNLDCKRRLPDVIGIGAKKCGTGALEFFLSGHPALYTKADTPERPREAHQWDRQPTRSVEEYRQLMPRTSQYQFTMEKTPAYFVGDDIPAAIARDVSRDVKLLLILRDPVKRAISDYTHVLDVFPKKMARRQRNGTRKRGRVLKYPQANISYVIEDTFEKSVINEDGTVNDNNAIIFTGLYSRHLRNWFEIFPREQILILDGDLFSKNPLPQLQATESFLGLPKYFDANKIYFDEAKGFFCLAMPFKLCMGKGKGRKHPEVERETFKKLYKFYEPYDKELEILTGRKFSWMNLNNDEVTG